ncbi:hypothetical protein Tdes44962_MAKER01356 [Teratosphaeria destructans]|uniref:F-box domain-containing protein n=1 Tax=Teratosphaeria destructans TaxID=418781 RepID=A0A9W7T0K1_9PEZI|nr:hypothetical protein Tdes44962_MAKER01356 [Teratosphaeria destructans]
MAFPGLGELGRFPAELRNEIYEYVLTEAETIDLFPRSRHKSLAVKDSNSHLHPTDPWKEPGLLKASSLLRREASAFYYTQNEFSIDIDMREFGPLCAWFKTLIERFGPTLFGSLHIGVDCPKWEDLHHARHLARLIHSTSFNPAPGHCRQGLCPQWRRFRGTGVTHLVCMPIPEDGWQVRIAVLDLVEVAVEGVRKGWDERKIERVLVSWFAEYEKRFPGEWGKGWWGEKVRKEYVAGGSDRKGRRIIEVVDGVGGEGR